MSDGWLESVGNVAAQAWKYVKENVTGEPAEPYQTKKRAQVTETAPDFFGVTLCEPPCATGATLTNFPGEQATAQTIAEVFNTCLADQDFYRANFVVKDKEQILADGCSDPLLDLSGYSMTRAAKRETIASFFYNVWSAGIFQPEKEQATEQVRILEQQMTFRQVRDVRLQSKLTLASLYLVTAQYDKAVAMAEEIINFPLSVTSRRPLYADEAVFLAGDVKKIQAMQSGDIEPMQRAMDFLAENYKRLGSGEVGYLRRYSYEMFKTCVDGEEQFGVRLDGCSEEEMARYELDATITYNAYAPFFADNFIAIKTLLQSAKHKAINGDLDAARQGYQDTLDLINGIENPDYIYEYHPDLAARFGQADSGTTSSLANLLRSDEQCDPKHFRIYQAKAYEGLANITLTEAGEAPDKTKAKNLKIADFLMGKALQLMESIKETGNYDFYKGAMFEERQTYYAVLADRADIKLNICYLKHDEAACQAAEQYALEVANYYQTRQVVEKDPEAAFDISYLKALLVLGETSALNNQHQTAIATFQKVQSGIAIRQQLQGEELPPFYSYLLGKSLIKEAALIAQPRQGETINSPAIMERLTAAETALRSTIPTWEKTAGGKSFLPVIDRLLAEKLTIEGETYLAQAYEEEDLLLREALKTKAELALQDIPQKHADLYARARIRQAEIMLSQPFDPVLQDPQIVAQQILANLQQAQELLAQKPGSTEYYTVSANFLKAKTLANLAEYHRSVNENDPAIQPLVTSAYGLFVTIPSGFGYLTDAAAVESNSLIAGYQHIFTVGTADLAALDQAMKGRDTYLASRAALTKGELLLQLAGQPRIDLTLAQEYRSEAYGMFIEAEATFPAGDYMQAKATILKASLMADPNIETRTDEMIATAMALPSAQAAMEHGGYLWQQAGFSMGEINLALADLVPNKNDSDNFLANAYAYLDSQELPGDLGARAAVLRGSIIVRQPKKFSPEDMLAAAEEINSIGSLFLANSYYDSLAGMVRGELLLGVADTTNDRELLAQAAVLLAMPVADEYEYLHHRSLLLQGSVRTRLAGQVTKADLAPVEIALAYFQQAGKDQYAIAMAYTTLGELSLRAADNPRYQLEALALFKQAKQSFTAARDISQENEGLTDLYVKTMVQEAAFIARKPKLYTEKILREQLAILDGSQRLEDGSTLPMYLQPPFVRSTGDYIPQLSLLTQGDIYLALAELTQSDDYYKRAQAAYAAVGRDQLVLHARAMLGKASAQLAMNEHIVLKKGRIIAIDKVWQQIFSDSQAAQQDIAMLQAAGYESDDLAVQAGLQLLTLRMADEAQRKMLRPDDFTVLAATAKRAKDPVRTISQFEIELKRAAYLAARRDYVALGQALFGDEQTGTAGIFADYPHIKLVGTKYAWDTSYMEAEMHFLAALYSISVKPVNEADKARLFKQAQTYAGLAHDDCNRSSSRYYRDFMPELIDDTLGLPKPEDNP